MPDVTPDPQGWCAKMHSPMLGKRLDENTHIVLELGSWLGQSTRLILKTAPNATVICVDHWLGSAEHHDPARGVLHKLPKLYETFLVNQWPWRDRVIPGRMTTILGMNAIAKFHSIEPDLVFIDASHDFEAVLADLGTAHELFPKTRLYGNDWGWSSVRAAVEQFAGEHQLPISAVGSVWALDDLGT